MLSVNATLENDKIVINGMRGLQRDMPQVLQRTLTKAAIGTHRESFDLMSGSGGNPGAYPVPVVTGHHRRMLDWLKPNARKGSFAAGKFEAIVYNSAIYAGAIHQGLGSSSKYGARPAITDGFERFNRGGKLAQIAVEEITIEARKKGFR